MVPRVICAFFIIGVISNVSDKIFHWFIEHFVFSMVQQGLFVDINIQKAVGGLAAIAAFGYIIAVKIISYFIFEGKHSKQVDSYKYVGFNVSSNKKRFKTYFDYVKEKSNRTITITNIYIRQAVRGEVPLHLYLKVFDWQLRPILEYGSAIWYQPLPKEVLETVQLRYLKKIIGIFQSTPTLLCLVKRGGSHCICDKRTAL